MAGCILSIAPSLPAGISASARENSMPVIPQSMEKQPRIITAVLAIMLSLLIG
jgi:hypothetical protein